MDIEHEVGATIEIQNAVTDIVNVAKIIMTDRCVNHVAFVLGSYRIDAADVQ